MADPVTLGLLIGGMGTQVLGSIFGKGAQRAAQKRAGTIFANTAEEEQKRALAFPDVINPYIEERYGQAAKGVTDVYNRSADDLQTTARQGYEDVMGQTREANAYLDPYSAAGRESLTTLSQLANAPEERFNFQFSQDDPSYQFRLSEGEKALQKSAAARGGLMGGGTLKALANYGQQAASQEYQAAFNRAKSTFDTNQAARQQRLGALTTLTGLGYGASGQQGQNLIGGSRFGADLTTRAAGEAGGFRNAGANWAGNAQLGSTNMQVGNIVNANDIARQLRLQGTQATVNSILGGGQASADMWGGAGQAIGQGLTLAAMMRNSPTGGYGRGRPGSGGTGYGGFDWEDF